MTICIKDVFGKKATDEVTLSIFYALPDNTLGLDPGWYEWSEKAKDIIKEKDCVSLTVAQFLNEKHRRLFRNTKKLSQSDIRRGVVNEADALDSLSPDMLAKGCVRNWSGFVDENGKEIPFSIEKAKYFLENSKAFYDFVINVCTDKTLFEDIEALAKN